MTKDDFLSKIVKTEYSRLENGTIICLMTLQDGFEILGSAAPEDIKNYLPEDGRHLAYADAVEELWMIDNLCQLKAGVLPRRTPSRSSG